MEIIVISDNKLKIMLCEEDLKQFELRADQLDYSNTETKRMFWDILSKVKHQTGFDTDGQRVLVQLYPSKEGGCEMFVTKMGVMCHCGSEKDNSECASRSPQLLGSNQTAQIKNITFNVFSFEKNEELLNVCRRLDSIGYTGESALYIGENGQKYLFLSELDFSDYAPPDEFSFILEYAKLENKENIDYYVLEHSKTICQSNAVSILSRL